MRQFRFYREDKKWYIDLPEYIEAGGEKEALEMILGADEWLESLSGRTGEDVFLQIAEHTTKDRYELDTQLLIKSLNQLETGAFYVITSGFDNFHVMWLCDVTKFVFDGKFPNMIRYKEITKEQYESEVL